MFIKIERCDAQEAAPHLVEIITPRTNQAAIAAAENLLAALSPAHAEPFALEMAATHDARWFQLRAATAGTLLHLQEQLGAAYPQAGFRPLDAARSPQSDPARLRQGEQLAASTLVLRAEPFRPLRTFLDRDVAAERAPNAAQADPVLGLLAALGDVPAGWRALSQLVLRPAPDDWCKGYVRLALEHPLEYERLRESAKFAAGGGSSFLVGLIAAGLITLVVGLQAAAWYDAGDWKHLGELAAAAAAVPGAGLVAWRAGMFRGRPLYDPRQVHEKIQYPAFRAQVRLAVFAPAECPRSSVEACLRRLAAAYKQFDLAAGNGLVTRPLHLPAGNPGAADALSRLRFLGGLRSVPVLNTREIAGLWHLPQAAADVPLLERTAARERLPLPDTVAQGCRIGVSIHQHRAVPVHLSDELLRRHLLLVAKTRKGKSSLLATLARYLMSSAEPAAGRPALVLVDPHRDLARTVLGLVPPDRREDVVYLDAAEEERPFGLNLLDAGLDWSRDKAVANALTVFKREFDEYWGPRMEDAFRFALLTLFEANQTMCAADPQQGRDQQHTILEVPALLVDEDFRRIVLKGVRDPVVLAWWSTYYAPLDPKLRLEIANPVLTKVQRFAGSTAARNIVGQPRSTLEPATWLGDGKLVIINTAKSAVGEDAAALIGGTLINLVGLVVSEQGTLDVRERRPVTLLVDEIHTMAGADYEGFLTELAKYGANIVLSTQSLERLRTIDREYGRALRAAVFSNIDGLFSFQVSAADAEYLAQELGGGLEPQDLLELGDYQCYARISSRGERLPAFSVHLDRPPAGEWSVAEELAAASAQRYGRQRKLVEAAIYAALKRIADYQRRGRAERGKEILPRNDHRTSGTSGPPKRPANDAQQPLPLDQSPPSGQAGGGQAAVDGSDHGATDGSAGKAQSDSGQSGPAPDAPPA
jgi:hypothetical protein